MHASISYGLEENRWCTIDNVRAHPKVLHNEMQDVDQLRHRVSLLHDDFASPVGQHLVAVLHAGRHCGGQDGHGLPYNGPGLHRVGLQQAVEDLNNRKGCSYTFIL